MKTTMHDPMRELKGFVHGLAMMTAVALIFMACVSLMGCGSFDNVRVDRTPAVANVTFKAVDANGRKLVGPDGKDVVLMDVRFDGDTILVLTTAGAEVEQFLKANGHTEFGRWAADRPMVMLYSRKDGTPGVVMPPGPLPAWLAGEGFFRPGEAEGLGLTFATE